MLYPRSETPSSILSSDSDIRFTRKFGGQYRCPCYCAAALILVMLAAVSCLYIIYQNLPPESGQQKTYLGAFRISEGDNYKGELADPETTLFSRTANNYRESLNLWLRRSRLRPAFLGSDILAFDGQENEDLVVHFTLRFSTRRMDVDVDSIMAVLAEGSPYLGNRTIDPKSITLIEDNDVDKQNTSAEATSTAELTTTTGQPTMRTCSPMELRYCQHTATTNITSYPNIMGHMKIDDVMANVIAFRELVDSECYRLAYEFVCQILQPPCSENLVLPCRSFCKEFWAGCGSRLPPPLVQALNCSNFPEYSAEEESHCLPKPGCSDDLESRGLGSRLCDGVPDCPDLSDETSCNHCPAGSLHCTSSKTCVQRHSLCDGNMDCPDGSDERGCLSLAPNLNGLKKLRSVQAMHYFPQGNVIFIEKGLHGKVCTENLNDSIPTGNQGIVLNTIGTSLCKDLSFSKVKSVKIEKDKEIDSIYVKMADPAASEISFIPTHCPSKQILSVECTNLECGLQSVRTAKGIEGLRKVASPGDWPWHIALFKSGTHICDGTLVELDWVITTASCFQGQSKAEWIARGGTTRLGSTPPWQQERLVVGMVKSPVEGSTVVLVKLERPFAPSDFVRPICLPQSSPQTASLEACNSLGWTKNRTVLQRVELKLSNMEQCSNISITTVNSICTNSFSQDCSGEELAGSPMLCLNSDQRWMLTGVSNWRIACSKVGDQRPRLYDQITSNVDWVQSTIKSY
ncbi:atrial natriuretic peptide-converting enzyme isoform X2 [Halyomorpha halys]|uniref:atrial natriuretic peptide-converting enzyme isoform X2 n=1 Tax=Halyomorpha halys TaxID=286706 RepID=UPI000D0C8510|nr:atrial natriuretic peptide-converting enzyme isoform X2 [Halyomorpha halys]